MTRPSVDVVMPALEPAGAVARLERLAVLPGDTRTVVDNRRDAVPLEGPVRVLAAPAQPSSYFARNRGAEAGSAEWLLFLDSDVDFDCDLLDRLFDPVPGERVGVLAGAVQDVAVGGGAVARWQVQTAHMGQHQTLGGARPYAQTAHCAVRRSAFEAVGGFVEGIRSGGDADLCFRLADAGWELEARPAAVRHQARSTARALLRQIARHGAGAAWLEQRYPGTFPERERPLGLAWWLMRSLPEARRSGAGALLAPAAALAFSLGRRLPNQVR